jgi:hypothetical protein
LLKTKNLRHSQFRSICSIRTKALVETRIELAELRHTLKDGDSPSFDLLRFMCAAYQSRQSFSVGKPCGVSQE